MGKRAELYTRCCDGDATAEELFAMYDSEREVKYSTFARKTSIAEIARELGYAVGRAAKGLRIADDYAVRFYKAKFRGVPVYYMDWSSIDHVFVVPGALLETR